MITIRYAMTVVPLFTGQSFGVPAKAFKPRFGALVACICLSLLFTFTSNPNRTLLPDTRFDSALVYVR